LRTEKEMGRREGGEKEEEEREEEKGYKKEKEGRRWIRRSK